MSDHPSRTAQRVRALEALGVLDTPAEARFDRITDLAGRLVGAPMSLVGLVDDVRQWNKSSAGVDAREWPVSESICRHVVESDAPMEVPDLLADERFAENAFQQQGVRFYAGWPLRDAAGTPVGAFCVLDHQPRRLTAEQRELLASLAAWAQAELNAEVLARAFDEAQAAERRLLELLDQAPGAVLLGARDGRVTWANRPARRMLAGDPDGSLSGTSLRDLLPALDLDELEGQGRRRADEGYTGRRFLQRGRRRDGSAFAAELTVSLSGAGHSRYIVFVRDLSEEQTSQAELAALRQQTEVVLEAIEEGVVVVQHDGRLAFGNLAAAKMLQRRRSDLAGMAWHEALHQVDAPHEPCELVDALALAGRTVSPVEVRRADGSVLPVELSVRLLHGAAGRPGVVVTLHDLTERLRAERVKNELVSAVSHELRTPLTSIRGSLSLLRAGAIDPASDQGKRMIDIATASSERLSRLVNDILDLERLQAGKVQLELARHRASSLLLAASQAVSGAAVAAGVRIDVLDSDERVIADHDRALQVLVNLLGNAVKFSPPGSTVTMAAVREGDRVRLSVTDQGRGIPADQLERIFDRFAQVDSGDSREFEGTGLGLAIAKGLAEQHGGSLSATSTVGEGSTFVLELPAATTRRRLLAYAPADAVPDELARVLGDRGWEAKAVQAQDLDGARAGALMLAPAESDEHERLRERAREIGLPLLTLTVAVEGGAELTAEVAATVAAEAGSRGHVLVVEDDDDLAEVVCAALSRRGFDVARAATQSEAVDAVRARAPELVVLDVRLAGGDGFGVVDDLREQGLASPPIVVYSVLELDDVERERLQTGGTSFLTKGRDRVEDVVHDVVRLLASSEPVDPPKDRA